MPYDVLIAPPPSPGLDKGREPRVLGANFGDGYGQRAPDGINTNLLKLEVEWKLLDPAVAARIDDFLSLKNGATPFHWKMPRESFYRKFRCAKWSLIEETTYSDIRASFEEIP